MANRISPCGLGCSALRRVINSPEPARIILTFISGCLVLNAFTNASASSSAAALHKISCDAVAASFGSGALAYKAGIMANSNTNPTKIVRFIQGLLSGKFLVLF